jgi:hypothetical protein
MARARDLIVDGIEPDGVDGNADVSWRGGRLGSFAEYHIPP